MFLKTQEFDNCINEHDTSWANKLESLLFAYRAWTQASTGYNPFMLMYGREALIPWQADKNKEPVIPSYDEDLLIEEVISQSQKIHEFISDDTDKAIKLSQKHQKEYYDLKHTKKFICGW